MSNGKTSFLGGDANGVYPIKLVAWGDGTYALSVSSTSGSSGASLDGGPSWTSSFGVSGARYTSTSGSVLASVTDSPVSGKNLVITDILVSVDTACRVDFKEQTSGTIVATMYIPANGVVQFTPRSKFKLATANKTLQAVTSVGTNIAVTVLYYSE